jgi:NAD(P)H-dependent FMN reductase
MPPTILVVLGSTRENRQGAAVARWIAKQAYGRAAAAYELVDLKDWPLPFHETSVPPALGQYDVGTRRWAERIGSAGGFIFVTLEYNHGYPAVLKNAIDHLYRRWGHKPAAVVSYGASGAGYRAAEQLRQVVVELRMVPVREQVGVPVVWQAFDEQGSMRDEALARSARSMLDELV